VRLWDARMIMNGLLTRTVTASTLRCGLAKKYHVLLQSKAVLIVIAPPPRPPERPVTAQELTATIFRMGQFQTADPYAGMIANFIRATMGAGLPAVPVRVGPDRIARLAAGAPPRRPRPPPRPPAVTLAAAVQTTPEKQHAAAT